MVIVAQKLKNPTNEVPLSKSIKDLIGGKSTLQNEILSDLGQEFSSAPEKGEEPLLEGLGAALGVGFNLSAIKSYLSKSWGLGPQRAGGVPLLSTLPNALVSRLRRGWTGSLLSMPCPVEERL